MDVDVDGWRRAVRQLEFCICFRLDTAQRWKRAKSHAKATEPVAWAQWILRSARLEAYKNADAEDKGNENLAREVFDPDKPYKERRQGAFDNHLAEILTHVARIEDGTLTAGHWFAYINGSNEHPRPEHPEQGPHDAEHSPLYKLHAEFELRRASSEEGTARRPDPRYEQLFGRDEVLQRLLGLLSAADGPSVLGIYGMGGIGKTFLASKLVAQARDAFAHVVRIESQQARLSLARRGASLSFEDVLTKIARDLRRSDIAELHESDPTKFDRLHELLAQRRTLIWIDNLETAADRESVNVGRLEELLGGTTSRALVVSRHALSCRSEQLTELSPEDGAAFAQVCLTAKGVELGRESVQRIAESAGGLPLAIDLVVGLLVRSASFESDELGHVLAQVRDFHRRRFDHVMHGSSDQDEVSAFYADVFALSWQKLSPQNELIIHMVDTSPGSGLSRELLEEVFDDSAKLLSDLRELRTLSLVHFYLLAAQRWYYLHPLTNAWVLSQKLGEAT